MVILNVFRSGLACTVTFVIISNHIHCILENVIIAVKVARYHCRHAVFVNLCMFRTVLFREFCGHSELGAQCSESV